MSRRSGQIIKRGDRKWQIRIYQVPEHEKGGEVPV